MIAPRRIVRPLRFVLMAAIVIMIGLFVRERMRHEALTVPDHNQSMFPKYPAGTRVSAENIDDDYPLEIGMDLLYEVDGTGYLGRLQGMGGDDVGIDDEGRITVNGERVGPIPIPGAPLGKVPEGKLFLLVLNPAPDVPPDSRTFGFIPREDVLAIIRHRIE